MKTLFMLNTASLVFQLGLILSGTTLNAGWFAFQAFAVVGVYTLMRRPPDKEKTVAFGWLALPYALMLLGLGGLIWMMKWE